MDAKVNDVVTMIFFVDISDHATPKLVAMQPMTKYVVDLSETDYDFLTCPSALSQDGKVMLVIVSPSMDGRVYTTVESFGLTDIDSGKPTLLGSWIPPPQNSHVLQNIAFSK